LSVTQARGSYASTAGINPRRTMAVDKRGGRRNEM